MKRFWFSGLLLLSLVPGLLLAQSVSRGPYLQQQTDSSIIVRWRTNTATESVVRFGPGADNLNNSETVIGSRTEHSVLLSALNASTTYFYSVGNLSGPIAGDASFHFATAPPEGTAAITRVWIIGDAGTGTDSAANVRDAFKNYSTVFPANLWLMLGDNAYTNGTDSEYQSAVFDFYPELLRTLPLWSTIGNHDGLSADSDLETGVYYDIFELPRNGEAGGLPSGTEAYYSFNYSNIHFICLNSNDVDRSVGGTMMTWLEADLMNNTAPWVIAFWHHPPYSKGSHNSDTSSAMVDMRENALPILEAYGVDLVLSGHSHSYERSFLLDSHYGISTTLDADDNLINPGDGSLNGNGAYKKPDITAMANVGAVYTVAGSSGKTSGGNLDHPAMFSNWRELGSVVIDVFDKQLDAVFLDDTGAILDEYTVLKVLDLDPPSVPTGLAVEAKSTTDITISWLPSTDNVAVDGYSVFRDNVEVATTRMRTFLDSGRNPSTTYTYEITAFDASGNESARSSALPVTTDDPASVVIYVAASEIAVSGAVTGNFTDTHSNDGTAQSIKERESGGKKSSRHSFLGHKWRFNITSGSMISVFANTWSSDSTEDSFKFSYSTDNINFVPLFTVSNTGSGNIQSAVLPNTISGSLYVRVEDSDQTAGNRTLDTIFIGHLYVRVDNAVGTPPAAPSGLQASSAGTDSINLNWTDNSNDELGFNIERSADGINFSQIDSTNENEASFTDIDLTPNTTYGYRVRAFNAADSSNYTPVVSATTDLGISLTLSGSKNRGKHVILLEWSDAMGTDVDIIRDFGARLTVTNNGQYTDNTGNKGGRTYTYQLCETAPSTTCSVEKVITF